MHIQVTEVFTRITAIKHKLTSTVLAMNNIWERSVADKVFPRLANNNVGITLRYKQ